MKRNLKILLIATLCITLGIVLLRVIASGFITTVTEEINIEMATTTSASIDVRAPTFVLQGVSGSSTALEDFRGGPLVIVFWSSWNATSVDQLTIFEHLSPASFPGVRFLAINVQEDSSAVRNFLTRGTYQSNVLFDETGSTAERYGAFSLPSTYFIDSGGVIRDVTHGVVSEEELLHRVESVVR